MSWIDHLHITKIVVVLELRTFTFSRSGLLALSGFSFVNFILNSVGNISKLYGVYFTSVSKVGRKCSNSGSSIRTYMK